MATNVKISVIGQDMENPSGSDSKQLRKQSYWGGDPWVPGMLPNGVLRTKVLYDAPAPYGQSSQVGFPKKNSGKKF